MAKTVWSNSSPALVYQSSSAWIYQFKVHISAYLSLSIILLTINPNGDYEGVAHVVNEVDCLDPHYADCLNATASTSVAFVAWSTLNVLRGREMDYYKNKPSNYHENKNKYLNKDWFREFVECLNLCLQKDWLGYHQLPLIHSLNELLSQQCQTTIIFIEIML